MGEDLRKSRELSEEEKKRIARDMIEGYKKMASLNQKLAENDFVVGNMQGNKGEADS
ncbi:MAG: hypothetical protein ACOCZ3_04580 [Bacillota bacterium]